MLHAFLDESGTHKEARVLSVAAFYGSGNQWRVFRKIWKPFAKGFHAKKSTVLFSQMCSAIERSAITGFLVTVNAETYRTHASNHMKTAVGNAYSVCTLLCARSLCDKEGSRRVSFVLEDGQPNLAFVRGVLEHMKLEKPQRVVAVTVARKGDYVELHTADFLSHIASTYDRAWMERLFSTGRLFHAHVTEEIIRTTVPEISEIYRRARMLRKELKQTAQGTHSAEQPGAAVDMQMIFACVATTAFKPPLCWHA